MAFLTGLLGPRRSLDPVAGDAPTVEAANRFRALQAEYERLLASQRRNAPVARFVENKSLPPANAEFVTDESDMLDAHGPDDLGGSAMPAPRLAAVQDGYTRQREHAEALRIARETGRDWRDVLREMRGDIRRPHDSFGDQVTDVMVRHVRDAQQRAMRAAGQARVPNQTRRIGQLSEQYESRGEGPGTISTGRNDPGGQSYGTWQLNQDMVRAFVNSNDARAWSRDFSGLRPGTPQFNAAWTRVAARDPDAFEDAQYAFIRRENYETLVARVRRATGLDLDALGDTVRDVAWSTAVHQGWVERLRTFERAIDVADRQFRRGDPRYVEALIRQVYRERIDHALEVSRGREGRDPRTASSFADIARRRLPQELSAALEMYRRERGRPGSAP